LGEIKPCNKQVAIELRTGTRRGNQAIGAADVTQSDLTANLVVAILRPAFEQ
jgi:hypothetical protein